MSKVLIRSSKLEIITVLVYYRVRSRQISHYKQVSDNKETLLCSDLFKTIDTFWNESIFLFRIPLFYIWCACDRFNGVDLSVMVYVNTYVQVWIATSTTKTCYILRHRYPKQDVFSISTSVLYNYFY